METLDQPVDLATVAAFPNAARCDLGGRNLRAADTCLVIGPEGGWADSERHLLPDAVSLRAIDEACREWGFFQLVGTASIPG